MRVFTGEGEKADEDYRKWKRWMRAYLGKERLKGTPAEAFGDIVFTLLEGKAADAVDRLDVEDWEVDGGEALIFDILDQRFPGKAAQDRIGEVLDELFGLRATKNEPMSSYTGRCNETFDKAEREGIPLPSLVRGYIMLRGCRLSREQKAIVLAASRRSYEENEVATALRTTFPVVPSENRQAAYANMVDEAESGGSEQEAEALVAEKASDEVGEEDIIDEKDAVQILVTWKETRDKIAKERLARGFNKAGAPDKPDLDKLRRRVRCYHCKQIGHFSRDCPKKSKTSGKGSSSSGNATSVQLVYCMMCGEDGSDKEIEEIMAAWAARAEEETNTGPTQPAAEEADEIDDILMAWSEASSFDKLVQKAKAERSAREKDTESTPPEEADDDGDEPPNGTEQQAVMIVHDQGYGCIDTGCGKGLVGTDTLSKHQAMLKQLGEDITWMPDAPVIKFKYGNGHVDSSIGMVQLPAWLGGKRLTLQLWVVPGEVPLLISKHMMKAAGAHIDMCDDTMHLKKLDLKLPLETARSGHYQINLLDVPKDHDVSKETSVLMMSDENDDMSEFISNAAAGFR